jgi:hypothetical protein
LFVLFDDFENILDAIILNKYFEGNVMHVPVKECFIPVDVKTYGMKHLLYVLLNIEYILNFGTLQSIQGSRGECSKHIG